MTIQFSRSQVSKANTFNDMRFKLEKIAISIAQVLSLDHRATHCRFVQPSSRGFTAQIELDTRDKKVLKKLSNDPNVKKELLQLLNIELGYSDRGSSNELTECRVVDRSPIYDDSGLSPFCMQNSFILGNLGVFFGNHKNLSNFKKFSKTSFVDACFNFLIRNFPFSIEVKMCFLVENKGKQNWNVNRIQIPQKCYRPPKPRHGLYMFITFVWFWIFVHI